MLLPLGDEAVLDLHLLGADLVRRVGGVGAEGEAEHEQQVHADPPHRLLRRLLDLLRADGAVLQSDRHGDRAGALFVVWFVIRIHLRTAEAHVLHRVLNGV